MKKKLIRLITDKRIEISKDEFSIKDIKVYKRDTIELVERTYSGKY